MKLMICGDSLLLQLLASPFLVGALFLPPTPWAFLSLLPAYLVGEMWIGVCLACVISLVPVDTASAAIALFLFIINNIGGTLNLLVPPLETAIGLQYALLILFPGLYVLAAVLFIVTFVLLKLSPCQRKHRRVRRRSTSVRVREVSPLIQNADTESSSDEDSDVLDVEEGEGLGASFVYITPKGDSLEQEDGSLEQELGESFESKI